MTPKSKKTMYYIIGAILLALALYFFWFKPKKKKENPNWALLGGSSVSKVNSTADGVLASQTAQVVPDTNVNDTDPNINTVAGVTRLASISGIRTLSPTTPTPIYKQTGDYCNENGSSGTWQGTGGNSGYCKVSSSVSSF